MRRRPASFSDRTASTLSGSPDNLSMLFWLSPDPFFLVCPPTSLVPAFRRPVMTCSSRR